MLAGWLVSAARVAGLAAQATSIPGVAQRTGATTYYLEIYPEPLPAGAPKPVLGLNPLPGRLDLLVSSELLETARQVANGALMAFLPIYVVGIGLDAAQAGLLFGVQSVTSFVSRPTMGWVSDRIGRRGIGVDAVGLEVRAGAS